MKKRAISSTPKPGANGCERRDQGGDDEQQHVDEEHAEAADAVGQVAAEQAAEQRAQRHDRGECAERQR
jgi:hypothetical protein